MDVKLHDSWKRLLKGEFEKEYFKSLSGFVKSEYLVKRIYPPPRQIFSAFELCPVDEVKVVIIGQDPYHGYGQANGLCFSVNKGVSMPPSLMNIFKEIRDDIGKPIPISGDLSHWAKQGVLLLNATLTVEAGRACSHQNVGWERFTDAAIRALALERDHLVYILWGRYARQKASFIDTQKNFILTGAHPSPFSAHNGFFGCGHFSKTNEYLRFLGEREIEW